MSDWFTLAQPDEVPSPALLLYPDRIRENVRRMIAMAGDVGRLRPHIKTHKLPQLIRLQLDLGISRFKCATLAEAAMAAECGARDILVAFPPVGPNARILRSLACRFPESAFSVTADDADSLRALSNAWTSQPEGSANAALRCLDVLIDLDVGMHRTGVEPGDRAIELAELADRLPGLRFGGLHAYDGHLHDPDVAARRSACEAAFAPVANLAARLTSRGIQVPRLVAGGTPTFPMHASRGDVECSPGTCVLWDAGYAAKLPDLDFLPAAVLLSRVISRPTPTRWCLDLGHKAVASEMPHPRVQWLNLPTARPVVHSEEHLVVELDTPNGPPVGGVVYAIPWHICPTVALHAEAIIVEGGRASDCWRVTARDRIYRA